MKLVLDATNIAPGGGLIVLGSILREWRVQQQHIEVSIFISRREVGETFLTYAPNLAIYPFMVGSGPTSVYMGRRLTLGGKIEKLRPDVVLAIASMVGRCDVPQHVHHQNLRWLMEWPFFSTAYAHGLKKTTRWRHQHAEAIFTLKNARCNTFISDYMRNMANRLVPESAGRNFTVHNAPGIAVKRNNFNPSPQPLIAAVQNADYYKDTPTLLGVLAECVKRRPEVDWRLKIAGGGNWSNARRLAEKMNIAQRVEFMGYQTLESIAELFDKAFCLVFPSRCEGFGIPPLEAMARGCDVISSNVDALPEVVGNGGVLVQAGDVSKFAGAVLNLWDNPSSRHVLVDAGYLQAEKFTWEKSAARMAELLQKGPCL